MSSPSCCPNVILIPIIERNGSVLHNITLYATTHVGTIFLPRQTVHDFPDNESSGCDNRLLVTTSCSVTVTFNLPVTSNPQANFTNCPSKASLIKWLRDLKVSAWSSWDTISCSLYRDLHSRENSLHLKGHVYHVAEDFHMKECGSKIFLPGYTLRGK